MDSINWVQVVVQVGLLAGAFIVMYWKQRIEAEHRFTKLEVLVTGLGKDHGNLSDKVNGISRNLSEISGQLKRST